MQCSRDTFIGFRRTRLVKVAPIAIKSPWFSPRNQSSILQALCRTYSAMKTRNIQRTFLSKHSNKSNALWNGRCCFWARPNPSVVSVFYATGSPLHFSEICTQSYRRVRRGLSALGRHEVSVLCSLPPPRFHRVPGMLRNVSFDTRDCMFPDRRFVIAKGERRTC